MTKFRAMLGVFAVLAMAICVFGVQSAAANTAYTCKRVAAGVVSEFEDAHCKMELKSTEKWIHEAITEETNITLTNETTGGARATGKLKSVQSGVTLELQATEVSSSEGKMKNVESGGEMWAEGSGKIIFKNVTVTAPSGKGCEVVTGTVTTEKLTGTTKGLTKELKFSPPAEKPFATFEIKGCSVTALNHVYTATGNVRGKIEGTTTVFNHATTTSQKELFLFGQQAGLEGSVTIKGANGNGIAVT